MVDKEGCFRVLNERYAQALNEFYDKEKGIAVINDIIEKVSNSKLPKPYSIKKTDTRLKEKIVISYLTNMFEESTLRLLLRRTGKDKWELTSELESNILNVNSLDLKVGYELYLEGKYKDEQKTKVQQDTYSGYTFQQFVKDRLIRLCNWKSGRNTYAKEFIYWSELQKKDRKDYLLKFLKLDCQMLFNQMLEDNIPRGRIISSNNSDYRLTVIQDQGVDFSIRKKSSSMADANDDIKKDLKKATEEFPELLNYNDFQMFYNVTENEEYRISQYYYKNQAESDTVNSNPKIFSTFDQKVITALVRLSEDVLVKNRASGTIREILNEIYKDEKIDNYSVLQYKAVYDSCLKIDNYKITVYNKKTGAYKPYQIASIEIKKADENMKNDALTNYGSMIITATFHPTYIEIIQNSVFIDGKLEKAIGSNNMAYSLIGPLQKLRYEAYLNGTIEQEHYLDYYNFFRIILVLTLRKKHDLKLCYEALSCIKESQFVIHELRQVANGFYVTWVPIKEEELENIRNGIKRFSSSGGQFKLYNNIITD